MLADLIPEAFFTERVSWLLWLLAALAIPLLAWGADRVVSAAVRLARALGMSPVVIGATVVSLGTTTPEAFVSVRAAFAGQPGLALGNGIGSIICDTALIFGLGLTLTRLPLDRFVLHRQGVLKLAAVALLAATLFALAILAGGFEQVVMPRGVGVSYVLLLIGYLYLSVRWTRRHPVILPEEARKAEAATGGFKTVLGSLLTLIMGLALVVAGSELMIGSVSELALRYGVPTDVLAVTVVAFGTSLPELVTALTAIRRGHGELMIGNIIGADILNVLFVIGLSATASPLAVPTTFFYLHVPVMGVSVGLMGTYIFTSGQRFHRWQGVPLLLVFAAYYVILLVTFVPSR